MQRKLLESTSYIRGGTEMTSFRARTEGAGFRAALSRDRSAGRHYCSFVEPSPHQRGRHRKLPNLSSPLTWITLLTLLIPWDLPRPTRRLSWRHFQGLFQTRSLSWLTVQTSLKPPKCPKTANKPQLASACPAPHAKCSQAQQKQQPITTCVITLIRWPQVWYKLQPVLAWNVASIK